MLIYLRYIGLGGRTDDDLTWSSSRFMSGSVKVSGMGALLAFWF